MKQALFLLTAVALSISLGCGQKNKDKGGKKAAPPTVTIEQCQVGQIFSAQHGCLDRRTCTAENQGYINNTGECVTGTVVTYIHVHGKNPAMKYIMTWPGLNIFNKSTFRQVLRNSGLCDRPGFWIGFGINPWSCETYQDYGHIQISGGLNNQYNVTLTGYHLYGAYVSAGFLTNYIGTGNNHPLPSLYSGPSGLRIVIESGKPGENSMDVLLEYQGRQFAEGTVYLQY